ncbi:hemagglutinin repeat-containing protein [Neisseria cinerea]|uniref:hemagglutinin repeat-containing protein n=1 Tax=Neisseria cinerea TaxID=483 RepID=UPI0027DFDFD7|nr:hemagglutinin repeat-containing protein [Neisseria cinerea]
MDSLKAGGDINIRSHEGDITVQGSNITAGDTIRLDSARDIRLQSAQDSQHQDGKNRNAGVQVGVGVSVGAQTGVYIYAEAAYGKGKNRTDSQTHQNTLLQSDKLQLSSKGNTVLNGAQAHARRIDADVGGTLYIESPQDTVEQESKQSGGGIRAQVALSTAWSVSGNYNQSKANGHSRSVGSQSGLFAGEGGYPYTVKNPVTSTFSLAKLSPNRPYLLWWYAALVKGPESGQNNLQVLFREILDRTDTGLELGKIVKELLPLPLLGQYRIGSIWIKRQVC